ncbi:hypothetical protein ACU0NG_26950, partial [Klebsiella pneumoniae]
SAQIREILISESAWEEMTCLFAPSLKLFRMYHSITEDNCTFKDAFTASFSDERYFGIRNNILAFAALAFASFGLFVCYKFVTQEITYSKIHTMIIVIVTGLLAFTLIKLRR